MGAGCPGGSRDRTMKTILVTGGCGFIGSCFVRMLLSANGEDRVVNVDALTYAGNPANLGKWWGHERHVFEHASITDQVNMRRIFKEHGIDHVVHFAAETHVDRSITDASPFVTTNVLGTHVLLERCMDTGIKNVVIVSTDEVYGTLGPADPPFTEDSPLRPNNPYSASKAAGDMLARAYHRTHGLPCIVTRCSNDYGPHQFPEKFIPVAILRALQDKPVPVYGDGSAIRDWVHVEDHCRGLLAAMERGTPGETYNFGGGAGRTNLDVVKAILGHLGKPGTLVEFVPDRRGHDMRYAMNPGKATRDLGWRRELSFEAGLARTVDWYKDNVHGWVDDVITGRYREMHGP